MKIVFISYCYKPKSAPRAIQVERLASHSANEILVITSEEPPQPNRENLNFKVVGDIRSKWTNAFRRFFLFPDPYVGWAKDVVRLVNKEAIINQGDVIVTFGHPMSTHLAGLEIAEKFDVKWIAHFSDPWVDNDYSKLFSRSIFKIALIQEKVFNKADLLIFTSEYTCRLMRAKYESSKSKITLLTHAYDEKMYSNIRRPPLAKNNLIIRSLGNFYGSRNPIILIKAIKRLAKDNSQLMSNVQIEFIGKWRIFNPLHLYYKYFPHTRYKFIKSVGYEASIKMMLDSDGLVIIDGKFKENIFFPSKLVEYLGSKKPIFAVTSPGITADITHSIGGYVSSPYSVLDVKEKLKSYIESFQLGAPENFVENNINTQSNKFEISNVAYEFDQIVQKIIN